MIIELGVSHMDGKPMELEFGQHFRLAGEGAPEKQKPKL